jgi:predicted dehydrogenase
VGAEDASLLGWNIDSAFIRAPGFPFQFQLLYGRLRFLAGLQKAIRMVHVGLIGFGASGRTFHAPIIHSVPGMCLAAVLQRSGNDASEIYPSARVVRTVDELLAINEIELAVIATPNTSHFPLARQCLLAGRHVIVDKPFTTTLQEAVELLHLARKCERLISVYQNSRWHGDFLTVRKLMGAGTLGRLVQYEAHFDRYRPELRANAWRERAEPGSGVFFDLGPHLIDQALVLFGTPEAVSGEVRIEREGAVVDDAFDIVLHYQTLRVTLGASMLACAPGPRFKLHGTRGSYVKYGTDPQAEALKRGMVPGDDLWGKEPEEMWGILTVVKDGNISSESVVTEAGDYRGYYANVRDAIIGQATLDVTSQQVLDVMRALEAVQESNRRGCVVPWPKG